MWIILWIWLSGLAGPKMGKCGAGGGVGRKPRLGSMKVQVALTKVKAKLEWIVPVQDKTENLVIIVGCVNWDLWRNLMGCDFFFEVCLWLHCFFFLYVTHITHAVTSLVVLNTIPREKLLQSKRMWKAKGEYKQGYPRGLSSCHASGRSAGNIGWLWSPFVTAALRHAQHWDKHNMPGMGALAQLRNHWVLCAAIQAFPASTFFLQICHMWAMLMSQQELSKKLQRALKLRVYCLVQIFRRNCWQCYFRIRICCTRRSNLSDECKKTVHITIQVKVLL